MTVFDVAAPELLLRVSILLIPILVLAVLFTLYYYHRQTAVRGKARVPERTEPLTLIKGTEPAPPGSAVNAESIHSIEKRLEAALASGEGAAEVYLELGRARMLAGADSAALDALRSAAGLAARSGPASVHAEARIELAEAAIRAGDPTSACEHWQMARMAYIESGNKEHGDKVDQRMRANGCPTDWVLTDF